MSTAGLDPRDTASSPTCEFCNVRPAKYEGKFVCEPEAGSIFGQTVRWPVCNECIPILRGEPSNPDPPRVHGGVLTGLEALPEDAADMRSRKPKATDTEHYRCSRCKLSLKGPPGMMFCPDCGDELHRIGYVQTSKRRRRK